MESKSGKESSILLRVAERAMSTDCGPESSTEEMSLGQELSEELDALTSDSVTLRRAVDILYPQGVPVTLEFYDPLKRLHSCLGFNDAAQRATGLVWSQAVSHLTGEEREHLSQLKA